jgi:hypothetical protein
MKLKTLMAGALLACALSAVAQEHEHGGKPPEMDPAMMQAMMAAGTPGEAHKKLDALAGTWDTKIAMWMAPGTEPMVSTGTAENRWIMGGRYLEQRYKGDFGGTTFEGIGFTGYDNIRKRYWSSWIDNMSTSLMTSTGAMKDAKTFTFTGVTPDPMTAKDVTIDETITVTDADHHLLEMWSPGPDGKVYKSMEISFSRAKGSR